MKTENPIGTVQQKLPTKSRSSPPAAPAHEHAFHCFAPRGSRVPAVYQPCTHSDGVGAHPGRLFCSLSFPFGDERLCGSIERTDAERSGEETKEKKNKEESMDPWITRPVFNGCRYVSGFRRPGMCAYKGRTAVAKTTR